MLQSARFGYTGANGNDAHQIQNKQVDNSSLYQTKPKTTRLQKRVSRGVVLMASTMLHEKCCNTVLQIGAPPTHPLHIHPTPSSHTPYTSFTYTLHPLHIHPTPPSHPPYTPYTYTLQSLHIHSKPPLLSHTPYTPSHTPYTSFTYTLHSKIFLF